MEITFPVNVKSPIDDPTPNVPVYLAPVIYILLLVKLMPFGKFVPIKCNTPA